MRVDLNADVGEGFDAADEAIIPLVSSVNVACGGHAGDAGRMARTIALAVEHGVAIGAHPGYPDREGFGRRSMKLPVADLRRSLERQLAALAAVASSRGVAIRHVKPHGALYTRAATDPALAALIAGVVRRFDRRAILVGLAGSQLLVAGREADLAVVAEGFADRAYAQDGGLRGRSEAGAVHDDPEVVARQALSIARDGRAALEDGSWVDIVAGTICLHGDAPAAADNVRRVREVLAEAGIEVGAHDPSDG